MQPRYLLADGGRARSRRWTSAEQCCGFGGTFSIKLGDISTRMCENKCVHPRHRRGAIVGGDLGCLLNIEGRLRRDGRQGDEVLISRECIPRARR